MSTWKSCLKSYTPAICGTVAVICGTAANIYCETVKFPHENSDATLFVGVFNYRTKEYVEINDDIWVFTTCKNYRYLDNELNFDYNVDSKMRTTMAFAIMTPIIGGIMLFFAYLAPCRTLSDSYWKLIGKVFLLTCLFQGLTLLVLQSNICLDNPVLQFLAVQRPDISVTFPDECEWAAGISLNIVAVVFWFLAGASTFVFAAPVVDRNEPVQEQTVTYQQNMDGTAEETNVAVVKGAAVVPNNEQHAPEELIVDKEKQ